jgi:hypothetical protein
VVKARQVLFSKQVPASGRVCSWRKPRVWPSSWRRTPVRVHGVDVAEGRRRDQELAAAPAGAGEERARQVLAGRDLADVEDDTVVAAGAVAVLVARGVDEVDPRGWPPRPAAAEFIALTTVVVAVPEGRLADAVGDVLRRAGRPLVVGAVDRVDDQARRHRAQAGLAIDRVGHRVEVALVELAHAGLALDHLVAVDHEHPGVRLLVRLGLELIVGEDVLIIRGRARDQGTEGESHRSRETNVHEDLQRQSVGSHTGWEQSERDIVVSRPRTVTRSFRVGGPATSRTALASGQRHSGRISAHTDAMRKS